MASKKQASPPPPRLLEPGVYCPDCGDIESYPKYADTVDYWDKCELPDSSDPHFRNDWQAIRHSNQFCIQRLSAKVKDLERRIESIEEWRRR
jgi:hypothetical protein